MPYPDRAGGPGDNQGTDERGTYQTGAVIVCVGDGLGVVVGGRERGGERGTESENLYQIQWDGVALSRIQKQRKEEEEGDWNDMI